MIVLPKVPTPPTRRSPKILVIYGSPKCGKTTAIAALNNCLITDVEDGSGYVEALKISVKNPGEFSVLCDQVIQNNRPYAYGALDTASKFEEWMEQEATEDYKRTTLGKNFQGSSVLQLADGGGYLYLRQAFQRYLHKFYTAFSRVILLCHVKDKLIQGNRAEDVKVVDKAKQVKLDTVVTTSDLDLTGKIRNIVCANADAIGYMFRSAEGKLLVSFASGGNVNCGARPEHLRGQTIELSSDGKTFNWDRIYID